MLTKKIYNYFSDVLMGIGCFDSTFKLQVRNSSHSYQTLPRRVTCALQEPLKEELGRL